MESKELVSDELKKILENVPETVLDDLLTYIKGTKQYEKLFRCTQMRDNVLRTNEDDSDNRGLHTIQVAHNASDLTKELLMYNNGSDKLENENDIKQVLIAEIVGIAHDLGHLPMGHPTEVILGDEAFNNPNGFKHDQYSGVVFAKIFEEFLDKEDILFGEKVFSEEEISVYRKSGSKEYIIYGVQNHSKYISIEAEGVAGKDLPLICARLADTLSFMPADLMDLSNVERAEGTGQKGKILTKEIMLNLVENGITTYVGSTEPNLPTEEITAIQPIGKFLKENNPDFNYKEKILDLVSGDKEKLLEIQAKILSEVAKANFAQIGDKNNPIVSISDNLKFLRSAELNTRGNQNKSFNEIEKGIPWGIVEYEKKLFKEKYIKENNIDKEELDGLEGKDEFKKDFKKYLEVEKVSERCFNDYKDVLGQEINELRKNCPTLALVYEMQDELIYNQILGKNTQVLGNDEKRNEGIIRRQYKEYQKEYFSLSEQEKKAFEKEFENIEKYMNLQKNKEVRKEKSVIAYYHDQKSYEAFGYDSQIETKEELRAKAYAIYKVQQLTNDDIDRIRETEDLSKAIEELGMEASLNELTDKGKESFKKILLSDRKDGKENVEVTAKTGNGNLAPTENSSKIRVAVFGTDNWKKVIGDRKISDLQATYNKVKEQNQKGKDDLEKGKNSGERDV